jgi:hypothetical protein
MCKKCKLTERNKTKEMRKISSECKRGSKCHFYGMVGKMNPANRPEIRIKLKEYQNRPEVREARRRSYVDMMDNKRYPGGQFYNRNACGFMDKWGKNNGYSFEHALNGKEFRTAAYWVDGYDKNKNVVFEYDEPYHFIRKNGIKLKPKDIIRMQRIQEELECEFIRYNELLDVIVHYPYQP